MEDKTTEQLMEEIEALRKEVAGLEQEKAERKKAEEALRESEGKYRALFESKLDGVFVLDAETMKVVLVNQVAAGMFGFSSPEEALGMNPLDFVVPEERERTLRIIVEDMFKKDMQRVNEFRTISEDGKEKWISAVGTRFEYGGKLAGLVSFRDITAQKRVDQELKESEEKYRVLVGNANEAIFVTQDGTIKFANPKVTEVVGYSKEELTSRPFVELIHPDDREMVIGRHLRRLKGEEFPHVYPFRVVDKAGNIVWVELNVALIKWEDKPATLDLLTDITERKKAEDELRSSEERLRILFEFAPDAYYLNDLKGNFIDGNKAAEKIVGYKREELIGESFLKLKLLPPKQILKVAALLAKNALGQPTGPDEFTLNRKDGSQISVEISTYPVRIKNQAVVLGIARDITERKKAEERLERSFVELAETVSRAMESRDPYTAGHQRRVAGLARLVGERMGLDKDRLMGLYIGGLLHDLGKISIPESILSRPGKLSEEEWNLIRVHPRRGYDILKDTGLPWPVADMALHHHEWLDGSGYPDGISGDELSLENRILGVCDVVEAMSSFRPYRPARSPQEILRELRTGRGTKYDAAVVDIMLEIIEGGEFELSKKR